MGDGWKHGWGGGMIDRVDTAVDIAVDTLTGSDCDKVEYAELIAPLTVGLRTDLRRRHIG